MVLVGRAAALGRAAGVEQALAVDADLVDRLVAVTEHDEPHWSGTAGACGPLDRPLAPLSWTIPTGRRRARARRLGQHPDQAVVVVAEHGMDRGAAGRARSSSSATSTSPACRITSACAKLAYTASDSASVSPGPHVGVGEDRGRSTSDDPAVTRTRRRRRRGGRSTRCAQGGCAASRRARPLRQPASDLARHLGEPLLDLDRGRGGRRDPRTGAVRRRQAADDVGERRGAGDRPARARTRGGRHRDRHRDERADDPRDLEAGLELGERPAPVGVGRVALEDRVERQLAGGPGQADRRRQDGSPRRRRPRRSRRRSRSTARASDAVSRFSSLVTRRIRGATAAPTRPLEHARRRHHAELPLGRPRPRKSNASSRVRKPTMPRSRPMAEPARMIPGAAQLGRLGLVGRRRATAVRGIRKPSTAATTNVTIARPSDHCGPNAFSRIAAGTTPTKPIRPLSSVSLEFASTSSASLRTTVGTSALRATWYALLHHEDAERLEEEDRAAARRSTLIMKKQRIARTHRRADHHVAVAAPEPVDQRPDQRRHHRERQHREQQVPEHRAPGVAGRQREEQRVRPARPPPWRRPRGDTAWVRARRPNGVIDERPGAGRGLRGEPRRRLLLGVLDHGAHRTECQTCRPSTSSVLDAWSTVRRTVVRVELRRSACGISYL